jgi:RNA methyltransferase, TrmH family
VAKDSIKLARIAGLPAVTALFATAPERVERLFYNATLKPKVGAFCAALARARKPYRLVGDDELQRVAGSTMHGGIVALAQPAAVPVLDPADAEAWARDGEPLVILDGVGNPQNLGAIARSAAFFGVKRLLLSDHPSQALPSDAAHRIAEGGLDYLALYRVAHLPAVLKRLRPHFHVVGTALGQGQPLDAIVATERPLALVFGNEEQGLGTATLKACESVATIAGAGAVQSLNVSASAAIFLYAAATRGLAIRQSAMTKSEG